MTRRQERLEKYRHLLLSALLALLYFGTGQLSFALFSKGDLVSYAIFPAEGIALAFALHYGANIVPGILIGQTLLAFSNGLPLLPSLGIGLVNASEALLAVNLFRSLRVNTRLHDFRDAVMFILLVVAVLQPYSALLGNAILLLHGTLTSSHYLTSSYHWWFANVTGQLIVTPFLLTLLKNYRYIDLKRYMAYGLLFAAYIATLIFVLEVDEPMLLFAATLPFIIFVLARYGLTFGTMMTFVVTAVSICSIIRHTGPFIHKDLYEASLQFNIFLLLYIALTFTFGVLFNQLKWSEKELQKRVEEALAVNRRQQATLMYQSRLAQMGEMLAMIAHQWRQPLNNLALANQLLVSKYRKGKLDDRAVEQFNDTTKKYVQLMSKTIDDFRGFFRPEASTTVFDVCEVIDKTVDLLKNGFARQNIAIQVDECSHTCRVDNYPNALMQVMLNLLNNARDALIETREEGRNIRIEIEENDRFVSIHVHDNGGGIPEEILPKIFDPYFTTKEERKGTGLGLYMSKALVEKQMKGRLKVFNDEEGARFVIELERKHTHDGR